MKPDNKLAKLRFEPEQAFENLKKAAKRVLSVTKREVGKRLMDKRTDKKP